MKIILLVAIGVALAPVVGSILYFVFMMLGTFGLCAFAYIHDFLFPPKRS